MGLRVRTVLSLLGVLAAMPVKADRRDLYTLVGYEAGVSHWGLPASGQGSATGYTGAIDLTAYYGFTNKLHLGARVRLTSTSDILFEKRTITASDGTQLGGDVFVDHRAVSVGGLALWRFETGALAPLLELGAGVTVHEYRNVAVVPVGSSAGMALPSRPETEFYATGTVLLEYRFWERWVASVGVGVQVEPRGLAPWTVFVPFRVGRVW